MHGVVPHSTEHRCHVVVASFTAAVPVNSRPRWKVIVLGLCVWASWRRPGRLGFLECLVRTVRSVPVQGGSVLLI